MTPTETQNHRRERLAELAKEMGGNANLGRALGYRDGAFIGQMLSGLKRITESTVMAIERLPGRRQWFGPRQPPEPVDLDSAKDLVLIRKVKLKLQAGISGFYIEPEGGEKEPIFFRQSWMLSRGYKPENLLSIDVIGPSMEPTLFAGDVVVVNTADREPRDGKVYAVNYEGESVIKRLQRDGGSWWLTSDNADQRRHPRKEWVDGNALIIGRVVHRQSEEM
ncbi:S24 family peptidase [Xylophilus sp. Kf1]|nr:S24 family peptidase [Xylophilus sp. Kf1]